MSKNNIYNLFISLSYVSALCWLYDREILFYWSYMGFGGKVTFFSTFSILLFTGMLALFLPTKPNARNYIISVVHYLFFIPSILIGVFNEAPLLYWLSLALVIWCVYFLSRVRLSVILGPVFSKNLNIFIIFMFITIAVLLQIAYGGLSSFNLNLERVYEFRREAGNNMPAVFGYVFSNVSNAFIPILVALGCTIRSKVIIFLGFFASILLLGMTHHKAVFFVPFLVLGFYVFFVRNNQPHKIGFIFLGVVFLAVIEVFIFSELFSPRSLGFYTSYSIRRTLLVPPLLDTTYIEFFRDQSFYYWSHSKLGMGIINTPFKESPPFLIGEYFYGDNDSSANTGIIGAGFANAGIVGVFIYGAITGFLISMLNSFGNRLGHAFVAASSLPVIIIILTTADLVTVFLTHGLLLLLIFYSLLPKESGKIVSKVKKNRKLESL